ncbi:hypothetical protein PLCT2_00824 [Planctomycetaceae bacterium]|nr:hypothetical protein PLCT2_00824 [Planctomycetaceae bacterium]
MFRLILGAICAFAASLAAQPYFVASPGHATAEHTIANPPGSTFIGGADWDPTGPDLYYWDGTNIRRFNTATNTPAATPLFTVPVAFGPYVDVMKFDPSTPTDLVVSDSGAFKLYRLRRSGLDTLASQSSGTVNLYIYDLAFDAQGRLLASASDATTYQCGIYLIDPVTLTERLLIDTAAYNINGSGPITFDAAGNLYAAAPPVFGSSGPGELLRFERSTLDSAIAALPPAPGPAPLDDTDGTLVVSVADNFYGMARMGFRVEDGQEVLYYTISNGTSIRRANLTLRQDTLFIQGAAAQSGLGNFNSALALRSGDYAPFGGGTGRMAAIVGAQNSSWAIVHHAIALIDPIAAPGGVASVAITQAPAFIRNGVPFDVTVEVRNGGGAPISAGAAVRLSLVGATGSLLGFTTQAASSGTVVISGVVFAAPDSLLPAQVQLRAEAVGLPALAAATTPNLPAYPLLGATEFVSTPTSVTVNQNFTVTVEILDNFGQRVTTGSGATATITLSIFSGTGTLLGTTSVAAVNGLATFNGLALDTADSFVLRASVTGLNAGLSTPITVKTLDADNGSSGCSTGENAGWLMLLLPLLLALRLRRVAKR